MIKYGIFLENLLETITPGQWQMSGQRSTSPSYKGHGIGPDNDCVVVVPYFDKYHNECLANARLLSMAPDLARRVIAAEKLIQTLESFDNRDGNDVESLVRAAIADYKDNIGEI